MLVSIRSIAIPSDMKENKMSNKITRGKLRELYTYTAMTEMMVLVIITARDRYRVNATPAISKAAPRQYFDTTPIHWCPANYRIASTG
jgi:hypothetical protein